MADYATGGVIPPGSPDDERAYRLLATHEAARTVGITLTWSTPADRLFADWLIEQIRPDDPPGVLAKV